MFVGGENPSPVNPVESCFAVVFVLIGIAFTAIFYGQTMSLIHSLNAKSLEYRSKIEDVNTTMEHLQVRYREVRAKRGQSAGKRK